MGRAGRPVVIAWTSISYLLLRYVCNELTHPQPRIYHASHEIELCLWRGVHRSVRFMNIDRRPLIRGIDCGTSATPRRADPELINSICVDSSYRNYLRRPPLSVIRPCEFFGDASFYEFMPREKSVQLRTEIYLVHQHFLLIYRFNLISNYVSVKLLLYSYGKRRIYRLGFLSRLANISISILFYDHVQVIQFGEET